MKTECESAAQPSDDRRSRLKQKALPRESHISDNLSQQHVSQTMASAWRRSRPSLSEANGWPGRGILARG